jgi:hypothetical protein
MTGEPCEKPFDSGRSVVGLEAQWLPLFPALMTLEGMSADGDAGWLVEAQEG